MDAEQTRMTRRHVRALGSGAATAIAAARLPRAWAAAPGAGGPLLAPEPLALDGRGGMPARHVPVRWEVAGYRAARQQILDLLATGQVANPVVLAGDIHSNRAADLKADFQNPDSATVGSEFVATSISSFGDTPTTTDFGPFGDNPHIRFSGHGRGYVVCRVTRNAWRSDYRVVDTVEQPESGVATVASFAVEAGRRGLQRA
jgi:phosphodiesterase/alkaline phosphatase D-like protein